MIASLFAALAALGIVADPPASAPIATAARIATVAPAALRADSATALPSGGPDFDATMLRWSGPKAIAFTERLKLPVPVTRLSSGFGVRQDPLRGGLRTHLGIDIPDPIGTPVRAVSSGTVTFAGWSRGYGNMVRIDHGDGNETRYAHLSSITVVPGAVDQGAVIGNVGSTGRSTGAHLHFEVRQNGAAVDPVAQDGAPLGHGERQPPLPVHSHWSGFGPETTALPQSRLR